MDIWVKSRAKKEAGFLWVTGHQALAVNAWSATTNQNIVVDYPSCVPVTLQTFVHKFWLFTRARKAWEMDFTIMYWSKTLPHMKYTHEPLSLEQCLTNKRLPNNLKNFSYLWSLLWGVVLWCIWIERNDLVFNGSIWHNSKPESII
jgi:hypothetical protein